MFFTLLVLAGIKRSSWVNIAIVSVTLAALGGFILFGSPSAFATGSSNWTPFFSDREESPASAFLYASALMFVAFTGYGRIATLGEEVREPHRTIPRAIIVTVAVTAALYICVAAVVVGIVGTAVFADAPDRQATTLQTAATAMGSRSLALLVAIGAITAMLGVLLNLILGLSRVVLAMGRRGDIPPVFGRLTEAEKEPASAVILVGVLVTGLAAIGSVETVWAFSAFTVLIYYAISNLAALRLPDDQRLYPRWISVLGLASCLFLAFWVPVDIWVLGLGLIGAGLVFKTFAPRLWKQPI
ncbi:MAG: amino acid permease [Citromicrobium sp.]|nr:amino acid permease [Citromicrobium sp.]